MALVKRPLQRQVSESSVQNWHPFTGEAPLVSTFVEIIKMGNKGLERGVQKLQGSKWSGLRALCFSLCCSCDDVRATPSRPLVDVGDLQGNGNERAQHHLQWTLHQQFIHLWDVMDIVWVWRAKVHSSVFFLAKDAHHLGDTQPHPPYLCLSVVSLGVPFETLGIYTDGGTHPTTTTATHTKHETGCIAENDP